MEFEDAFHDPGLAKMFEAHDTTYPFLKDVIM